jgi:PRTRC genetic system protein C
MQVGALTRYFTFASLRLPDPDPRMSPEEVRTFYSAQYPEITTASITGPEAEGDKLQYRFGVAVGTKG